MTYNVFGGTLNLTQSINQPYYLFSSLLFLSSLFPSNPAAGYAGALRKPHNEKFNIQSKTNPGEGHILLLKCTANPGFSEQSGIYTVS